MDSDEKKELNDDKQPEDESSTPVLEESSEKILEEQVKPSASKRSADPKGACGGSPRKISPTSEFPETAFSLETQSACNIPSPGKYTALIQRHKQLNLKEDNIDEISSAATSSQSSVFESNLLEASSSASSFRIPDRGPTLSPRRQGELGVKEDNSRHQQFVDRSIAISRAASLRSSSMTSGTLETSRTSESIFRTSDPLVLQPDPLVLQPESLIHRYRDFNLMDSAEQVRDRPAESSSSASSRNNSVSSALFEASLRATEGVSGLPGPFASFIQRHRDFDEMEDNSDEENIEPRQVFVPNLRWPDARALNRGFRSGSLSAFSEESTSRSASEASHSSGLQENREASASDSLPMQQHHRELNPPNDEATDEDEGDLESEEQSQDSDSERKGYSL